MNCDKCGLENVENSNYCPNCGNHLTKDQETKEVVIEEAEIIETEETEEKPLLKEDLEPFPQPKDAPIKNKAFMFNATVILILIFIRLIFALINNEFVTAFGLGTVLGNSLLVVTLSGIFLIFIEKLSSKKRYIIATTLIFFYFSFLLGNQILVVNHEKELDELTLKVDSFLVDSAKDFYSGKPISKSNLKESEFGEFYEFSSLAIKYFEDVDLISKQLVFKDELQLNYLYSQNLPDNLSDQKTLLNLLRENISILVKTSDNLKSIIKNFEDDTNALIEKEDTMQVRAYMVSFLDGFTESTESTKDSDAIIIKTYNSYCDILEFLISQNEKYYIENDQFFFYTEDNVNEFNSLIQNFITNFEKFNELNGL